MINRLEEQLEFGVVGQPALRDVTFMDHEVVDDENDTPSVAISALDFVQQMDEQQRVFAFALGPYHVATACVQGAS